jgi:hypothetical protein
VPLLGLRRCRHRPSSYGIGGSFRVSHPLKYHRYGFRSPALPLAVASAVRFSLSGFCRLPIKVARQVLSSSFTFLESVTQQHLPDPSQRIKSSHGLLLPTAHTGSKIHLTRARPPATVRLQGLVTLLTAYSLRSLAGFVSHRQRSWDSPFGGFPSQKVSAAFPPGSTHLPLA